MRRLFFFAIPLLVACEDPPPPSLGNINFYSVSNEHALSVTYVIDDSGRESVDLKKGVFLADGLSVSMNILRTIADPPASSQDADKLTSRPFTLAQQGDVASAVTQPNENTIILSSVKQGTGGIVFSVNGVQGSITMPVTVVDQNAVPPDVHPPGSVPEAGADQDAGTDGG